MALRVIRLPKVVAVRFGVKDDPERVKKVFGGFPRAISLAPVEQYFPRHNEWPEGEREEQLGIAWFPGEYFPKFDAVSERISSEGLRGLTVVSHLVAITPMCDELWERRQKDEGPAWIYTSDPASLWRHADGSLCVPCVDLSPRYRRLDAGWTEHGFLGNDGFLVAC